MYNPFTLEGKTILVTGASSGIGQAAAIECSKMGAKLIITGRNEERLNETLQSLEGNGHVAIINDLTSEGGVDALVKCLNDIDGAVLCAGVAETLPIKFSSTKKFQRVLDINLLAQVELIRLLIKHGCLKNGASVVAISSIAAYTHSIGNSIYGITKAGLSVWMKYAAQEMGPKGIRFNSICPAMVETPMIKNGPFSEEQLEEDKMQYPLRRYGQPKDIAYGAVYLLSDASSWITGIDLVIDGGIMLN